MNKPVKLPEIRKEVFTKAREDLGLSTKDLSGMACLSVRQIEQIENGESSSFYGAQVKVTAAKKVAGLLKLKEEDVFDFGEVIPAPKSAPEKVNDSEKTKNPEVSKEVAPEKKRSHQRRGRQKKVESQPEQVALMKTLEPIGSLDSSRTTKRADPKKKLLLILGIAAALVFSVVNLRPLFFPEPPKEEIVVVEEVIKEPEPEAKPEAATPPSPAPVAAPVAAAPAAVSTECPAADSSAISYKPDAPKKAGDMVFLQSKTAQTVCVVDATGKTQTKQLEPGVDISVYGKPPLKVLTGGLNQVDLFYQGAKVRLGNTGGKTIVLEPAEIAQPAAPASSDSQLR
ncbi:helix-turn-helix domain-containing protein [Polynucleobacter necessarius]|uniref:helix-turn-helix domain-containing protein n=1 Tax=Polynucleobacter necessarius TaxID=576610 RepID=UPI000FE1CCBF|nr:helix-turn-helix domain-containing protein [Polynucleobacter necessarius]